MRFLLLLSLVLALTGCRGNTAGGEEAPDTALGQVLEYAIAEAQDSYASEEQIGILKSLFDSADIPFSVYSEAVDREIQCVRDAGIEVGTRYTYTRSGVDQVGYTWRLPGGLSEYQADSIVLGCKAKHTAFIELAFLSQPSSIEAYWSDIEGRSGKIRECLVEASATVPLDISLEELVALSYEVLSDSINRGDTVPVDCIEAGI